jgi:hypothetical protein
MKQAKQQTLFGTTINCQAFQMYQKPMNLYQRFMNKFCSDSTNLKKFKTKTDIIKEGDKFWAQNKDNVAEIEVYISKSSTVVEINSEPRPEKSWISVNPRVQNPVTSQIQDPTQNIPQNTQPKANKRKTITNPEITTDEIGLLKRTKYTSILNYENLKNFLFCDVHHGQNEDMKEVIEYCQSEEETLIDNFLLLTKFQELYDEYQLLTTFSKRNTLIFNFLDTMKDHREQLLKAIRDLLSLRSELMKNTLSVRTIIENNEQKIKLENLLKQAKINFVIDVGKVGGYIGNNIELLRNRVEHLRSYYKGKHTQSPKDHRLSFYCLNTNITWNDVHKIYDEAWFNPNDFHPISLQDISNMIQILEDSGTVFMRVEILYKLIFEKKDNSDKKMAPKTKWSNINHLKNILIELFPVLLISYHGASWIMDLTKVQTNLIESVNSLICLIENELNFEEECTELEEEEKSNLLQIEHEKMEIEEIIGVFENSLSIFDFKKISEEGERKSGNQDLELQAKEEKIKTEEQIRLFNLPNEEEKIEERKNVEETAEVQEIDYTKLNENKEEKPDDSDRFKKGISISHSNQ